MSKPNREKKRREQKRLADKKDPALQTELKKKKQAQFKKNICIILLFIAKALIPAVLSVLIFGFIYPKLPVLTQNTAFCVVGFIGSALLGAGISLFIYGKKAYKILLPVGLALALFSCFLMCKISPAEVKTIAFYYYNIIAAFAYLLMYATFRFSVGNWLRGRKISITMIRKSKNGAKNFWWYEELHKNFGLSSVYTLNKTFTVFLLAHLTASLFLGWLEKLMYLFCISLTLLALLCAAMLEFSRLQDTRTEYGCSFVLLRQNSRKGIDSSLLDLIFTVLLPLGSASVLWLIMYRY